MRAFWERGFQATSISDLTGAMGIAAPSLYAAFGDKQSLFREVVESYGRTLGAFAMRALTEAPDARTGVARMLRQAAVEYTDPRHPRGCLIITAAVNCGPDAAEVEQMLRELRAANLRRIEDRIRVDLRAGLLPPETDVATLATFTAVTLQGMSQQARDGADRARLEAVAETAMRAWP